MKYLLSALIFLGYLFFSIPSFAEVTNNDPSFNLQDQAVDVINRALLPKEVIKDASNQASLDKNIEIGVVQSFTKNFTDLACGFLGMIGLGNISGNFCKTGLSVGENTAQYTAGSKILGQSAIPDGMELIPATKSTDLGDFTATNSASTTGDEKINQLSENLGTTTGFFRDDQPTLSDYDACIQDRMKKFNFDLNGKSFEEDQRSADIFCSKQVFCKGNYPNGICPFEPSPTLTP